MLICLYGVATYFYFFYIFLCAMIFTANGASRFPALQPFFPFTIDGNEKDDVQTSVLMDCILLGIFALQHIVMARKVWKKMFGKIFPDSTERTTFVLASTLALHAVVHFWYPINAVVWSVPESMEMFVEGIWLFGWVVVLLSTFNIDHFELFGLRQTIGFEAAKSDGFVGSYFYKFIRHPIMTGFLIAFWATPNMTQGHLVFAVMCTGFILFTVAVFEEPALMEDVPEYAQYMKEVPSYCPMPGMAWSGGKKKK